MFGNRPKTTTVPMAAILAIFGGVGFLPEADRRGAVVFGDERA